MSKVPTLSYLEVLRALQRDGWVIVRQKDSHIRLQKRLPTQVLKITVAIMAQCLSSTPARRIEPPSVHDAGIVADVQRDSQNRRRPEEDKVNLDAYGGATSRVAFQTKVSRPFVCFRIGLIK